MHTWTFFKGDSMFMVSGFIPLVIVVALIYVVIGILNVLKDIMRGDEDDKR